MITIINYGAGNLFSVEKAFAALGAEVHVSSKHEDILSSDKIVLPGVGAFGASASGFKFFSRAVRNLPA